MLKGVFFKGLIVGSMLLILASYQNCAKSLQLEGDFSEANSSSQTGSSSSQLTISFQSGEDMVSVGDELLAKVNVSGQVGTLSYKWELNGQAVTAQGNSVLLSGVKLSDNGAELTVIVTDETTKEVSFRSIILRVIEIQIPQLILTPASASIYHGDSVQACIGKSKITGATYQWYNDAGAKISGANQFCYDYVNLPIDNAFKIKVDVKTESGTIVPRTSTLVVKKLLDPLQYTDGGTVHKNKTAFTVNFGTVKANMTHTKSIAVKNIGARSAIGFKIVTAANNNFTLTENCTANIAKNATCTLTAGYKATVSKAHTGSFKITYGDTAITITVKGISDKDNRMCYNDFGQKGPIGGKANAPTAYAHYMYYTGPKNSQFKVGFDARTKKNCLKNGTSGQVVLNTFVKCLSDARAYMPTTSSTNKEGTTTKPYVGYPVVGNLPAVISVDTTVVKLYCKKLIQGNDLAYYRNPGGSWAKYSCSELYNSNGSSKRLDYYKNCTAN